MAAENEIVVYSKERCPQCVATKRYLDDRKVEYTVVDVEGNDEAIARLKEMNYIGVPVVEANRKSWHGFRPDMLDEAIKELAAA